MDASPTLPLAATNTPAPTATATPLPTPTPKPEPSTPITATVWERDPYTVILTYHQFAANHAKQSTGLKVRFVDFEYQLNQIYEAGFSLIALEDWMKGNIVVPEGRRPLILSMDDLYFNNQLRLDENDDPLPDTGMGILWRFSEAHPDFGLSAALFINLGDKLYGNPDEPTWEMELAQAIAWGMDHNLMPYNHFYTHPRLDESTGEAIIWEAEQNDLYLRELLRMAGREDLISRLSNIIALTYGIWPKAENIKTMLSYTNPEGLPVQAVMEIDPISVEKYLPPPYHPTYDTLHLPRHVASPSGVDFLVANAEKFPRAQTCFLGDIPDSQLNNSAALSQAITTAVESGCPDGVYVVLGFLFRVEAGQVQVITLD